MHSILEKGTLWCWGKLNRQSNAMRIDQDPDAFGTVAFDAIEGIVRLCLGELSSIRPARLLLDNHHDDVIKWKHLTGPLGGEFTAHRWIPLTKASDVKIWCLLWSTPHERANNRDAGRLRRHCQLKWLWCDLNKSVCTHNYGSNFRNVSPRSDKNNMHVQDSLYQRAQFSNI